MEQLKFVSRMSAGIFDEPDNKYFHWVNTMIGNVKRSVHITYHSVSSKHLPRYLAEFNFRFNNRFQVTSKIDVLLSRTARKKINFFVAEE